MNYQRLQAGVYVGLFSCVLLSIFMYCLAPVSGAHMNCMVTFTTIICGLCPLSRGIIYIFFQLLGAGLAGAFLVGCWGVDRALESVIPRILSCLSLVLGL